MVGKSISASRMVLAYKKNVILVVGDFEDTVGAFWIQFYVLEWRFGCVPCTFEGYD